MAERVADHVARLQALDSRGSFIVQAPAGSGKTELLIQRFLTLLGGAAAPESIVAITFTRKAAGEMRYRVVEALEAARGDAPEEPHRRNTWELARSALRRNDEQGWRLAEYPARLRIQTFDALCGSLVRQMPWISRMGAAPRPEERVEYLYHRAARRTLRRLDGDDPPSRSLVRLLQHLDNDLGVLEELLVGMLRRRDQWLRHVVGTAGTATFRDALESAFAAIAEQERRHVAALFPSDQLSNLYELARFALDHCPEPNCLTPLAGFLASGQLPGPGREDLDAWVSLAGLLLKANGERRRRVDRRHGFPPTPDGRLARQRFKELEFDEALLDRLHMVRRLHPMTFTENQWEVLGALAIMLPIAAAELNVVFREEGSVDFVELAHAARLALGTAEAPTDLAFALDCRIEHILVDEFQDTSQTQYGLLEALTDGWVPGDGRTLFLVGDPMQSIYGFREADVALFLKVRNAGIGNLRPKPLTLAVNFRSDAGIVGWVNRALGPAFPPEEDLLTGGVTYAPSEPFHPERETPAVSIHPFLQTDLAAEADCVLDLIRQAESRDPDGTIGVLVRARNHLDRIVTVMRASGKRFQAVEIDRLDARPAVSDLLTLTRALLNPADRLAWLALLRAPWCGLTLADLETLIGGDFDSPVWDLIEDSGRLARLSSDGRTRLERMRAAVGPSMALRGRLGLRRWVEGTWIALGGPATVDGPTGLEDAAACLELLDGVSERAELADPGKFKEAVDGLYARPDVQAEARLQLLTVHKAKGLEFDTVILPGLGRSTREEDEQLMLWLEHVDINGASRLLLAPITGTGGEPDPAYRYLAGVRKMKSENENIRLLYVAATRARKRLHLLGHTRADFGRGIRAPLGRSLLSKIWPIVKEDFEAGIPAVRPPSIRRELDPGWISTGLRRLSADWPRPSPRADIDPRSFFDMEQDSVADTRLGADQDTAVRFDWAGDQRRRIGSAIHALLRRAGAREVDRRVVRNALVAEGVVGGPLEDATDRVVDAMRRIWADERGRWILATHPEDRREFVLSGLVEGRVRRYVLDRTFVEDGVRWIIDYKTGIHQGSGVDRFLDNELERYRTQLENYAKLVRGLDGRPIRLGLYFPLLQGWREWAFSGPAAQASGAAEGN